MRSCDEWQECFQNQRRFRFSCRIFKEQSWEADNRMILNAKHAINSYDRILIANLDTDVFVLFLLAKLHRWKDQTDVNNPRRIIDIKAVGENLVTSINVCNTTDELFLAFIWFPHSFTECDIVSTFSGRGTAKPLKPMTKSLRYTQLLVTFSPVYSCQ